MSFFLAFGTPFTVKDICTYCVYFPPPLLCVRVLVNKYISCVKINEAFLTKKFVIHCDRQPVIYFIVGTQKLVSPVVAE